LTFKVLKNDLTTIIHRNVVRSAADAGHRSRRVTFKPDVQEQINKLDTKSGFTKDTIFLNMNLKQSIMRCQVEQDLKQTIQISGLVYLPDPN
jgi:hypothetical protein